MAQLTTTQLTALQNLGNALAAGLRQASKSGVKTSEFYMTIAGALLTCFIPFAAEQLAANATGYGITSMVGVILLVGMYGWQRYFLKDKSASLTDDGIKVYQLMHAALASAGTTLQLPELPAGFMQPGATGTVTLPVSSVTAAAPAPAAGVGVTLPATPAI